MSLMLRINKSLWGSSSNNTTLTIIKNDNDDNNNNSNKIIYEEDKVVVMPHNVNRPLINKFKHNSTGNSTSTTNNNDNSSNTEPGTIIGLSVDPYLQTELFLNYISSLLSNLSLEQQESLVENSNIITPISHMTYKEVAYNLSSLRLERIQRIMRPHILKLMQHTKNGNTFNEPVNPIALGIPLYFTKIKHPMDLGTIRHRLQNKYYTSLQAVIDDVRLVFINAISFNPPAHVVHKSAVLLLNEFDTEIKAFEEKFLRDADRKAKHACSTCKNNHCILCGEKCLKQEPPNLNCHGTCYQRIKRDSVYYVSVDGILVWCCKCYAGLPHVVCQQPPRPPLLKRQLLKRKLEEELVERWVKCSSCSHHVHQICAHYNSSINNDGSEEISTTEYRCPLCQLELKSLEASKSNVSPNPIDIMKTLKSSAEPSLNTQDVENNESKLRNNKRNRDDDTVYRPLISTQKYSCWSAKSLPRSNLSDFLEMMVTERLKMTGFGDVAETITIRMTYNNFQSMEVPTPIIANLMTKEGDTMPRMLKYKQKCILMFQNVDGVDLCLFCMYANEFDEHCPPPNKSVIYIAYLDSVDFFQPIKARTLVYHEIMVGYLKWAQSRGFKQGHIWSCPPQRGDNFIFWYHPVHQRTPQRDRLNSWYNAILQRSISLGFIDEINTLWDIYFSKYNKKGRDQTKQRLAAKNNALIQNAKTDNINKTDSIANNIIEVTNSKDNVENFEVPICPPLFEGDFWVNEFVRIHRSFYTRAKSSDGLDANTNQRKVKEILKQLMLSPLSIAFNEPVDPVALHIPTYFKIIKTPMDLGTVKGKLKENEYATILDFAGDVRLVFQNSITFNPPVHHVHLSAVELGESFENNLLDLVTDIVGELANRENMDSYLMAYPLRTFDLPPSCLPSARIGLEFTIENNINNLSSNSAMNGKHSSHNCNNGNGNSIADISHHSDRNDNNYNDDNLEINDNESSDNIGDNDTDVTPPPLCRVESLVSSLYPPDMRERDNSNVTDRHFSNFNNNTNTFDKPQLGNRALLALMNELARGVERIKDSLFVLQFTDSNRNSNKMNKADENSNVDDKNGTDNQKSKNKMRIRSPRNGIYNNFHCENDNILSESCLKLLDKLKKDTSDPDDEISSPFVDSRHTFLEMCQFRRYQFDTLRRVKYSSLMLLYHLHNPNAPCLRPKCAECKSNIIEVRWHCSNCDSYDICSMCNDTKVHTHVLTPHRVTFF